jgi:hypothetical protein
MGDVPDTRVRKRKNKQVLFVLSYRAIDWLNLIYKALPWAL